MFSEEIKQLHAAAVELELLGAWAMAAYYRELIAELAQFETKKEAS